MKSYTAHFFWGPVFQGRCSSTKDLNQRTSLLWSSSLSFFFATLLFLLSPTVFFSLSFRMCPFRWRCGFVPFHRLRPHETLSHHLYSFFLRTCSKDVFFRLLIFFPFLPLFPSLSFCHPWDCFYRSFFNVFFSVFSISAISFLFFFLSLSYFTFHSFSCSWFVFSKTWNLVRLSPVPWFSTHHWVFISKEGKTFPVYVNLTFNIAFPEPPITTLQ